MRKMTRQSDIEIEEKQGIEGMFIMLSGLRSKMSFLIDNMWAYYQLDVLEVQWA